MAKKTDRLKEARARLRVAKGQWDGASIDSWEPQEPAECVTKCFYAYENALTAAATALGVKWTKKHYEKVKLARELFEANKLKTDVSSEIERLNELRKDIQYGELNAYDEDGDPIDLEDLVSNLELFIDEVDEVINALEED